MVGKQISLLGLLGLASATALEAPRPARRGCLVLDDGPHQTHPTLSRRSVADLPGNFSVDVHFHIASTEEDEDLITDAIVEAQWKVLRDAFARYNINLVLASTERVVDNITGHAGLVYEGPELGWVNYEKEMNEYYKSSRKGGYDQLNLYFFSQYGPGATGYCRWPTVRDDDDQEILGLDSCQLSAMTMPGFTPEQGAFEEWNLGHLTVHEAGHWFGLNHTFAGGCSEPGDFVADTPAQLTQIYGCPIGSNSCPDRPGVDPIHNYMGYTQDNWYVRERCGVVTELTYTARWSLRRDRGSVCLRLSSGSGERFRAYTWIDQSITKTKECHSLYLLPSPRPSGSKPIRHVLGEKLI